MGLENLKSVFNDLSENVVSEAEINGFSNINDNITHQHASRNPHKHYEGYGGHHGQGIHGGWTNERPSTPAHPDDHSLLDLLPNVPLLGPDNLSMSPTLEFGGRHGDLIIKKSGQKEVDKPHPDNHSQLDNGIDNTEYSDILNKLNSPIATTTTDTIPITTDYSIGATFDGIKTTLGTGEYSGINVYDKLSSVNITKRSFDPSTLGKDQELGDGDYVLETLYLNNHRGSPERIQIDTGKKDWEGNAITINTGRAGMGSLGNLDIKGYSSIWRNGIGFLKEPYIVHNIPKTGFGSALQGVGQNRDLIPFRASLDDISRLAQFYTSPAGVAFMLKENITNVRIGDGVTLTEPLGAIMAPPIPTPRYGNTGFLNFIQQSIQGAGLGSIRKPFKIQYSDRTNIGLSFVNQGDRTLGVEELQKIKINPKTPKIVQKGLHKLKDILIKKLATVAQVPLIGKPTPFIDLRGAGKHDVQGALHGYDDKISAKGVVGETTADGFRPDDVIAPNKKGDFYVRIKDLRNKNNIFFRGFVTGIVENVSPAWTPTNYIGRSEPVYMYERAERDLSFNLRVYPANEIQFKSMYEKINALTSLAYPNYQHEFKKVGIGDAATLVEDKDSQIRMQPPFTELYMAHIGSRKKGQFGFIKSLSYTVNDSGDWDALSALPRLFDIAISYQILNRKPPQMGDEFYRASV
jgi:hypothetical protein